VLEPAPARKRRGAGWFKLLLIALIAIGVVAMLVKSIWSSHGAPPTR
jgi:hypothetical protein